MLSGVKVFNNSLRLLILDWILLYKSCFAFVRVSLISCFKGIASSAAALGVGARTSAAKSLNAQSISCPTAEITGISESAMARTTPSSLNGSKSSREPPPRHTIKTSHMEYLLAIFIIFVMLCAASSPCTRAGKMVMFILSLRLFDI